MKLTDKPEYTLAPSPEGYLPMVVTNAPDSPRVYRVDRSRVGIQGDRGPGWLSGVGAPGPGDGYDGDHYLDTGNGNVYLKTAGTWAVVDNLTGPTGPAGANGSNGANGANGADGADGSVWYSGAGAPTAGDGVDGDYWLRTSNEDVYYKSSGSWAVITNIKGSTGATGATGSSGIIALSPAYALDDFEDYSVGAVTAPDQGYGWQANGIANDASVVTAVHRNGNTQKRLSLGTTGTAYYRRKLGCDNGWTKLRVAFALRINGTGNKTGAMYMGIFGHNVNGITYGCLDGANAPNWIGIYTKNGWAGADATWTDTATGTMFPQKYVSNYLYGGNRTGAGTYDGVNLGGAGAGLCIGRQENDPIIGLFQLERPPYLGTGSVTYTVTGGFTNHGSGTGAERVYEKHGWKDYLNGIYAAMSLDHWFARNGSWSFNEAGGELDAFEIAWTGNAPLQVDYIGIWAIQ